MIVAFSTSSPLASVALLEADGCVLASSALEAKFAASGACLDMLAQLLRETGRRLEDVELCLADLGPGSFTGVRAGVTLAKTMALALGVSAGGASSFDLIDPSTTVLVPSRKGEAYLRRAGQDVERVSAVPAGAIVGYGPWIAEGDWRYPEASRFGPLMPSLKRIKAEELLPMYVSEPSISTPRRPYGCGDATRA
ncbi:MAG: tRNA (adenosine(37)-N6)-threonylcarbamoyltransferase complex dimerization subunit type 1 TsaB [Fimbriimonas ginsengisoli]|uniref:tRNA (Adenosine(37)-N6)-threonylcarbamoyltransferase complex dimerization subunit type 1 TsaB n=1 Tax=Fimbriimonas ginsengisoli TaxID=1005039 RepID=A0A931LVP5_FIMGI|nr:tRNA (adenosine(37)-N6)-threonylcarbamoyltransferase complex dimerization subunit type 1 TsaB [Fimbriimonas ginsengisoli]